MTALIGYANLLDSATLTASAGVAADACNYLTNTAWSPGGAATLDADANMPTVADYVGVVSSGCDSIALSCREGADWVEVASIAHPGAVWCAPFKAANSQEWRITVTGASPRVRHVSIGTALSLPANLSKPFTEPKYASRLRAHNADSQGGQHAGRGVFSTTCQMDLPLKRLTAAWLDAHWEKWAEHMRMKPFFLLWDPTHHAGDAAYLWLRDADKFPAPRWNHPLFQTLSLALEGIA